MKYLNYIWRNARRNPVRSLLTIASTSVCLFLMMILLSFFAINDEVTGSVGVYNRVCVLNANGFAGRIPIAFMNEIAQIDGVQAATPFSWFGGKYHDEILPFAQFAVDADTAFTIMNELTIAPDQLKAFQTNKNGCVIGRKLANERKLKIGDPMPLERDLYPVDLDLTIQGIYDGPANRDLRMCLFHWGYLDELLKRVGATGSASEAHLSGNAGMVFIKCKSANIMPAICKAVDDRFRNSDYPTRTQTEEAFGKMFAEMLGDLKGMIRVIGMAVVFSLLCVAGNSMAMSMRERTTEVAVLKAIGFGKRLVLTLVLTEAVLVATIGGAIGSLGCKALCEVVDLSRYSAGFLPFYYIPWPIALEGLAVALLIGFVSGLFPALRAANSSVVDGLRKVI